MCVFFLGGMWCLHVFRDLLERRSTFGEDSLVNSISPWIISEVSADGRLLEGAKTLCNAALRDGDAITVVAQGVSWLQTNHLHFVGS